jgi:protein arginine kinase
MLRSARLMASEETLLLLSHLRMGVHLGRVKDIDIRTINELFLLTQPAHLQKMQGRKLDGDLRRAARADYIRCDFSAGTPRRFTSIRTMSGRSDSPPGRIWR